MQRSVCHTILFLSTSKPKFLSTFLFNNPFSSESPIVQKLRNTVKSTVFPPIPPNRTIFHDPETSSVQTFSSLHGDTLRIAHGIHSKYGFPETTESFGNNSCSGPVVLLYLSNCVHWPLLAFGFLAAGWTVTAANPSNTSSELAHIISICHPKVIISQPGKAGEGVVMSACKAAKHHDVDVLLADPENERYDSGTTKWRTRLNRSKSWISLLSDMALKVDQMVCIRKLFTICPEGFAVF